MLDFAVKNGLVVDGSRGEPFWATVYLKDGKIAEICDDASKPASGSFDAGGCVVCPGFVDIHSHSDRAFAKLPTHEGKVAGGVAFELVGQCGDSLVPLNAKNRKSVLGESFPGFGASDFAGYADEVEKRGVAVNLGALIGHGTLRSAVVGWEMRPLTEKEMRRMCALLDEQLAEGALGLSLGLIYPPGSFCGTEELVSLAEVVAARGKMLAVHMRNENRGVFDAFEEMAWVAERTGVKLQISHLKLMGSSQWGRADELLHRIDLARSRGAYVHCDQYPYTASSSGLTSCLPGWAAEGGYVALTQRLRDPDTWKQIIADGLPEMRERGGAGRIVVSGTLGRIPEIEGMSLNDAALQMELHLFEAVRQILIRCGGLVNCTYHSIDRGDMLKIMSRTDVATASDGSAHALKGENKGRAHPRSTSTFVRFLQTVREEKLMPLQDAVYKITALPAALMGLGGRIGRLERGFPADITVFDFDAVADVATYEAPLQQPEGIRLVMSNGETIFDGKNVTGRLPGHFYRG